MRYLIIFVAIIFISLPSFGQKTQTLSAETPVRKSTRVENMYPKITLNDNKCRFDHLTIKPAKDNQYELSIVFERPCDDQKDFILTFGELSEAILVKDVIINDHDYTFFHLFKEKDKTGDFKIVYPASVN